MPDVLGSLDKVCVGWNVARGGGGAFSIELFLAAGQLHCRRGVSIAPYCCGFQSSLLVLCVHLAFTAVSVAHVLTLLCVMPHCYLPWL